MVMGSMQAHVAVQRAHHGGALLLAVALLGGVCPWDTAASCSAAGAPTPAWSVENAPRCDAWTGPFTVIIV